MLDNRTKNPIRLGLGVLAVASAALLSACGSGGGDTAVTPPPAAIGPARFGAKFATAFNASPNSDPIDPAVGDIIALSLTTDPLEVP